MNRTRRAARCGFFFAFAFALAARQANGAEADVLARVRAQGVVRCATIVRPGVAVPTVDGAHWYGIAPDVCRAVAAAVLGDPTRVKLRPYLENEAGAVGAAADDDIVFLSGNESIATLARDRATLQLGPAVMHDALALLVPASSAAARIADLAGKKVCVEPGTPADRALVRAFARRGIALREHPFQESDEMRQAYGTGNCDALAGPLTTLANVRSDPSEGRPADRILPELLADDPIFAATGGDARWSRIVWWTFSVLVDAEEAGVTGGDATRAAAIPGVPPLAGRQLGLAPGWARDALAAGGNYGELFERDLGAASRLKLTRGDNALWSSGGSIFALHVE